ncbi:MAG: cytochrome c peroxidase [Bacteroidota bacterium]
MVIIISCCFFRYDESLSEKYSYVNSETEKLLAVIERSIDLTDSASLSDRFQQLRSNYFLSRTYYKHIECFIEYCAPFDVKYFINGPLVKKTDLEIGSRIVDPHGFQVVEEQLFGADSIDLKLLKAELQILKGSFIVFKRKLHDITVSDSQQLEAMQFELIRMCSLSLNGSDATYTKTNTTECVSVFQGFRSMLNIIRKKYGENAYPSNTHAQLISRIKLAENYCTLHKDYDSFNRLYFITHYVKPVYALLVKVHRSNLFPFTPVNYAINLRDERLFERSSYNLNYFTVKAIDTIGNSLQAKLGELLFFDPVLSGNNQRACASCHKPDMAFCDGLEKGLTFENKNTLDRNTPSLLNAIFQKQFFYDGRARQLEQQASDVLHNQKEMNATVDEMISRLNQSEEYKLLFKNAYNGTSDTIVSYYGILKAITEYEKTLISMNSRFDKYIKGDYKQLSIHEINGYTIFSGKALCGSCHFFPLFNGLVPPVYNDTEYEVIGVPETARGKYIDKDEGRRLVSRAYIHQYAFKTTTIRNSALTSPYMHNGIYKTLDEVIEFYNKGGGQGLGINIPHQTLPFDSLSLSKKEMSDVKAFLLSLTDTVGLTHKPNKLPVFNDPILNKRTIGGTY